MSLLECGGPAAAGPLSKRGHVRALQISSIRLAPKARCIQRQPGAAPQEKWSIKNCSAEGAIQLQIGLIYLERLKRAFSAGLYGFRSPGAMPQARMSSALSARRDPVASNSLDALR